MVAHKREKVRRWRRRRGGGRRVLMALRLEGCLAVSEQAKECRGCDRRRERSDESTATEKDGDDRIAPSGISTRKQTQKDEPVEVNKMSKSGSKRPASQPATSEPKSHE